MATGGVYILGGSLGATGRLHGTHRSFHTPSFPVIDVAMERSHQDDCNAPRFV